MNSLPRRAIWPLDVLLAGALVISPSAAAVLRAVWPPAMPGVYCLSSAGTTYMPLNAPQVPPTSLPVALAGVVQRETVAHGWCGSRLFRLEAAHCTLVHTFPMDVQAIAPLPDDVLLVLSGGSRRGGQLIGVRVVFYHEPTGRTWPSVEVDPSLNPFLPWTARHGASWLAFLGVRKTAAFDPAFTARPFIYSYSPGRGDLVPRWQGTSLARPYLDVVFADIIEAPGPELCALEQVCGGHRQVTAYQWTGRGVEGVAQSESLELGDRLDARPGEPGGLTVFGHDGDGWRALRLTPGNSPGVSGVKDLVASAVTEALARRPDAWSVVWSPDDERGQVMVRTEGGACRLFPWRKVSSP